MVTATPQISVIIPTQRRLQGLEVAVRSVLTQADFDFSRVELVIVDNDQAPSAQPLATRLAAEATIPVIYVHEPAPGVANARNAALAAAHGDWIAFLDDDEEAGPAWLSNLLSTQARFDAEVVFGPVRGRAPQIVVSHRSYLEWFFSRTGPDEACVLDSYYGCGNSLIRRAAMPHPAAPFSMARNHTGGEDDLLFSQMKTANARFAWAPAALVWEDPQPERLSLNYAFSRAFAYGHGPTETARAESDWIGVVRWMLIGLGQGVVFSLLAGLLALIGSDQAIFRLDYAIRCFGKTFWWGPFRKTFYGRSAGA